MTKKTAKKKEAKGANKKIKRDPCPICGGILKHEKGTKWVKCCTKDCPFSVSVGHRFKVESDEK